MFRIVFYYNQPAEAKHLARQMTRKPESVRVYDVSVWDGTYERCDEIIVTPDVPGWQRKRIEAAYGKLTDHDAQVAPAAEQTDPAAEPVETPPAETAPGPSEEKSKTIVNMGGGRWFVMRGSEQISGPHTRSEAQRLAAE